MEITSRLHKSPFFLKNGKQISNMEFIRNINGYRELLLTQKAKKVILKLESPQLFAAAFFAAASLKISIVLLPNYQDGTISLNHDEFDFMVEGIPLKKGRETGEIYLDPLTDIFLFTSGSSGQSVKVEKKLENLLIECKELERQFSHIGDGSLFVSTVSFIHIYGLLFRLLWPLLYGHKVSNFAIEYEEDIEGLSNKEMSKYVFVSSPAFLKRLGKKISKKGFSGIFSSGGRLERMFAELVFNKYSLYPIEIYGSTETGGVALRTQENGNNLWTTFDEVVLKQRKDLCLTVYSPYIQNGSFETQDIIQLESDSQFLLKGRIDRIFKVEEKKVSLIELEERLVQSSHVEQCHCLVLESSHRSMIACLVVESSESSFKGLTKLKKVQILKTYLGQYYDQLLVPKKFRFLKELPYNEQSKLSYNSVREYFEN